MRTIKGPAQFVGSEPPFDRSEMIARRAADLGYVGLQLSTGPSSFVDLATAAASQANCDEIVGVLAARGLALAELSTHLQGQLVAVHPAYDPLSDAFAAPEVRSDPVARQRWAVDQLMLPARASRRLGLSAHVTFSGALARPDLYPWPQRHVGLVEDAFFELGRRWWPILDASEDEGADLCHESHPGEDLDDGVTFERFVDEVGGHARANILYDPSHFLLQQLDYFAFLDRYHERVRAFHVKDAEFRPDGRSGVYGGFQSCANRPARFRSPGKWADRLRRDLLEAGALRLSRLGGARVGVRAEAPGGRCAGGRSVHPGTHHQGVTKGLR